MKRAIVILPAPALVLLLSVHSAVAASGSISGMAKDQAGAGLPGICVSLVGDHSGEEIASIQTDPGGNYSFEVAPGDYRVGFRDCTSHRYIASDWSSNPTITVADGQSVTGTDSVMSLGGSISGTVTDESGLPLSGICVNSWGAGGWDQTKTATDGGYRLGGFSPETYKAYFSDCQSGQYLSEFYNNTRDWFQATGISITDTSDHTGIDASLTRAATIGGHVTGSDGTALAGICVHTIDNASDWHSAITDSAGDYMIGGLVTDDVKVAFNDCLFDSPYASEWYNDQPTPDTAQIIHVTLGEATTGIDAGLAVGGSISGTITDTSGQPLANICVVVDNHWATSDAFGHYLVRGLHTGSYKVPFLTCSFSDTYLRRWYGGDTESTAVAVPVSLGQESAGIDVVMSRAGTITGHVTVAGQPTAGVCVQVYTDTGSGEAWAYADTSGFYRAVGLKTGTYRVKFGRCGTGNFIEEWYNNQQNFADANTVAVTAEQETSGIDADLDVAGSISGTVRNAGGEVLNGICVRGSSDQYSSNATSNTATDRSGHYQLTGLTTANYRIIFEDCSGSYATHWYRDAGSYESADLVAVTSGIETRGIDMTMVPGASISGSVSYPGGQSAEGCVYLYGLNNPSSALKSAYGFSGRFTLTGISPGDYKMKIQSCAWNGFVTEWYQDKPDFDSATVIHLDGGQSLTNVNVIVSQGSSISGHVVDASGIALADFPVYATDSAGSFVASAYTDGAGSYRISALPAGNYRLQFNSSGTYEQWYHLKPDRQSSDVVNVGEGQDVTALDEVVRRRESISGTVTDSAGRPVLGCVYLVDSTTGAWHWANIDTQGHYKAFVTPGTYKAFFCGTSNYQSEWYNDKLTEAAADTLAVQPDQQLSGIDAVLSPYSHIEGTVVDVAGRPVAQMCVFGVDPGGSWHYGSTDAAGHYSISVPAGAMKVYFCGMGNLRSEWYRDKHDQGSADVVDVAESATVMGIDATLEELPWISGRVTGTAGEGLAGVCVRASSQQRSFGTQTDATGAYSFQLDPGSYKVYFCGDTDHHQEWYNDKTDEASADTVTIADGQALSGIDATLTPYSHIEGAVTDETGHGIVGTCVQVTDSSGIWLYNTYTDSTGHYRLQVDPGELKVHFCGDAERRPEWYNNKADVSSANTVTVSAGSDSIGIDAVLASYSHIQGSVTDSSGNPVVGACVYATNPSDRSYSTTDSSGHYSIPAENGDYKVYFCTKDALLAEWYNDKQDESSADTVTVVSGVDTVAIDATLAHYSHIQGNVTDSSGNSVVGACVYATNASGWRYSTTDASGNYSIPVNSGDYKIEFCGRDDLRSEWYNDKTDQASADLVSIGAEQDVLGIDAVLTRLRRISGTVVDSAGQPVSGDCVYAVGADGSWRYSSTDATGQYRFSVDSGAYKVYFCGQNDLLPEWYNDKADQASADSVQVSDAVDVTGVDAVLERSSWIEGRVTGPDGAAVADSCVRATSTDGAEQTTQWTDSSGRYRIATRSGSFKVAFCGSGDLLEEWFNNKSDEASADVVAVAKESIVSGIDATLDKASSIAGRVVDGTNRPLVDSCVYAIDGSGTWHLASTDQDGRYLIPLREGRYKVYFCGSSVNRSEWYNDKQDPSQADLIDLARGAQVSGIDAELANLPTVQGTVTDEKGAPVDACVYAVDASHSWTYSHSASDGSYRIALNPGAYKIYFCRSPIARAEWYNDKKDEIDADALSIDWGASATGVNAVLSSCDEDADGDGLDSCAESQIGTDPHIYDTDDDGLSDGEEVTYKTNPLVADSDGDLFDDGFEVKGGSCLGFSSNGGSDPNDALSTPFAPNDPLMSSLHHHSAPTAVCRRNHPDLTAASAGAPRAGISAKTPVAIPPAASLGGPSSPPSSSSPPVIGPSPIGAPSLTGPLSPDAPIDSTPTPAPPLSSDPLSSLFAVQPEDHISSALGLL